MTIYKCDRCGAAFETNLSYPKYEILYKWQQMSTANLKDLCKECERELKVWFECLKQSE